MVLDKNLKNKKTTRQKKIKNIIKHDGKGLQLQGI